MRTCHVGIYKGRGHTRNTLYLQACQSVDFLSCETWLYLGEWKTTKAQLHRNRRGILDLVNQNNNTAYHRLIVE